MINILPAEVKEAYRYSRRNYSIRKWLWALVFALIGALTLTAAGYFYIDYTTGRYDEYIATNERQLEEQNYKVVERDIQAMSNNLKLTEQVLSKQVLFSELLTQLSTLMPQGTRLKSLNIVQADGAIDIVAEAKSQVAATQVQVNLADENSKLFSKADTVSITCNDTADAYPCTANIRALFAKDNPFLLINSGKTSQQRSAR